jgi:hypothetical protein
MKLRFCKKVNKVNALDINVYREKNRCSYEEAKNNLQDPSDWELQYSESDEAWESIPYVILYRGE